MGEKVGDMPRPGCSQQTFWVMMAMLVQVHTQGQVPDIQWQPLCPEPAELFKPVNPTFALLPDLFLPSETTIKALALGAPTLPLD